MISKIEKTLALRYLRPQRKEGFLKIISIFSFLGISLGVAILIIVMSVMNGFRSELVNKILGFNPHIVVKPYEKKITQNYLEILDSVSNLIQQTSISLNGEGIILQNKNTKGILVRGYYKKDLKKLNILQNNIIDGTLDKFDKNTVSIGKDLAISLNLIVGDKINIMSTSNVKTIIGSLPIQETFIVSSVFSSGLSDFDQNVIFMPLQGMIGFFEESDENIFLEIFLKRPEDIEIAKNKVQNLFNNYYVYSWADLNKSLFAALKVERNVMFIILSLIVIVAAFNIISGLTILVKNKTKEIAILRTLGVSKNSITKIFFITGFFIGFLATTTGVLLGVLFSLYVEEIRLLITALFNIKLFPEEIYFLSKMPSEISIKSILVISSCSLFMTLLAAIFPSLSASKLDPIKALKYE